MIMAQLNHDQNQTKHANYSKGANSNSCLQANDKTMQSNDIHLHAENFQSPCPRLDKVWLETTAPNQLERTDCTTTAAVRRRRHGHWISKTRAAVRRLNEEPLVVPTPGKDAETNSDEAICSWSVKMSRYPTWHRQHKCWGHLTSHLTHPVT